MSHYGLGVKVFYQSECFHRSLRFSGPRLCKVGVRVFHRSEGCTGACGGAKRIIRVFNQRKYFYGSLRLGRPKQIVVSECKLRMRVSGRGKDLYRGTRLGGPNAVESDSSVRVRVINWSTGCFYRSLRIQPNISKDDSGLDVLVD